MTGLRPFRQAKPAVRRLLSSGLLLLGLAACQTAPESPPVAATGDQALMRPAAADESIRYEIRPDLSEARFLVFRAGPFARFGHNHVVQATNIRGEIRLAPDIHQSGFFIEMPVGEFRVDVPDARSDEGEAFARQPDDEAVAGTRRNMLGEKVLDAARYPAIEVRSVALGGPAWALDVTARIKLHGVEREVIVPTTVDRDGRRLTVTAQFQIKQTDFGITPMRILGGAIQVDDTVKVRMRIVAEKGDLPP